MIEQALEILAYIVSRFCLGLIVVIPLLCTIAPVFLKLDSSRDPRN